MVPDLRSKASQALAFMMRCVRSKLNELITTAMSSIEERVDRKIGADLALFFFFGIKICAFSLVVYLVYTVIFNE